MPALQEIVLLGQAVKEVKFSQVDLALFRDILSNGNKFKRWTAKNTVTMDFLAKALKWETQNARVRTDVIRHIVEKYNRLLTDANRNSAYALVSREVA